MEVTDRIAVWNGTRVQRSIVSAGTPTVVLLGQNMKCGGLRTLGAAGCAISQHGVNSALAIASLFGASRRGRQVTGGPGVVWIWWRDDNVLHFCGLALFELRGYMVEVCSLVSDA
jgi:hypothetical protein